MNLQLNKEYRFINHPRTFVKIREILELDNDEVYLRYINTDTILHESYEDWRIIKKDMIEHTFEDIPEETDWISIKDDLPPVELEIKGYTSDGDIRYVSRHNPDGITWKTNGVISRVNIIKWKFITE